MWVVLRKIRGANRKRKPGDSGNPRRAPRNLQRSPPKGQKSCPKASPRLTPFPASFTGSLGGGRAPPEHTQPVLSLWLPQPWAQGLFPKSTWTGLSADTARSQPGPIEPLKGFSFPHREALGRAKVRQGPPRGSRQFADTRTGHQPACVGVLQPLCAHPGHCHLQRRPCQHPPPGVPHSSSNPCREGLSVGHPHL